MVVLDWGKRVSHLVRKRICHAVAEELVVGIFECGGVDINSALEVHVHSEVGHTLAATDATPVHREPVPERKECFDPFDVWRGHIERQAPVFVSNPSVLRIISREDQSDALHIFELAEIAGCFWVLGVNRVEVLVEVPP